MIPLDKLKTLKRAYVHANCPDGVASALVLKDALPDLEVHFVKYDTKEHKEIVPEPNTIFCDFSPWLPKGDDPKTVNMRKLLVQMWRGAEVVVLDHHDPKIVEPYSFGVFGENSKLECGAMLAFQHVWVPIQRSYLGAPYQPGDSFCRGRKPVEVEEFARLAAIRDTWKKDDPDFEKACRQAAVLMFFRLEQISLDLMGEMSEWIGERLFERQIELAHTCIKEAQVFLSAKGTRVLMFQGVSATSDAAEILEKAAKSRRADRDALRRSGFGLPEPFDSIISAVEDGHEPDLVVGFHYRNDGGALKLQFSTRSHTGFDCRAFAQAHGGNGHVAAAGFTIVTDDSVQAVQPYAAFRVILDAYEESR